VKITLPWAYFLIFLSLCLVGILPAAAQNVDEAKVVTYTLPDPLTFQDGTSVKTARQWRTKRRAEILELCEKEMYGRSPGRPANLTFKVWDQDKAALKGTATRKQVTVYFTGKPDGPQMDILLYLPNQVIGEVSVFLGLNFQGNHGVHPDTAIRISPNWVWGGAAGVVNNRSTEKSRGSTASRWPIDLILARGYGVATVFANDIDPDYFDNFQNGVHALYPELQNRGDNFSTMAAWAWGLSRALDYLQTDPNVHPQKVMLFGFSRMGKTALWAGARDERFAMVISNESGGGGAALSKRNFGEDVERLNRGNPHWFCRNFRKYNKNEAILPFDQHMVISLIAPRPVYVASAEQDLGADPYGEFLGLKGADPVYRLLGTQGLPATEFPKIHQPIWGRLAYHIRAGKHDVTRYDWEQFLNFSDYYWHKKNK
jgi:hypothetical protein